MGNLTFDMATVRHKRWDPCLLYRTSLIWYLHELSDKAQTFLLQNDWFLNERAPCVHWESNF